MNQELLVTAREAASAGAQVLRSLWGAGVAVEEKQDFDFVTEADRRSQEAVLAQISRRHPGHAILAEESDQDWSQWAGYQEPLWVVDPLDGTTNFIHGFPQVAVSVAVLVKGRPQAGVVLDVTRDECFAASAGGGAWLGERRLAVSPQTDPARGLLMTGFPFRDKKRLPIYMELFSEIFRQVSGVRRAGAAALDLAYVAAGRGEGFWEIGLKPWDVAAGFLLIEEAGGVVSDFAGGDKALWRGDVVTAGPALHPWLQQICARYFPQG